MSNTCKTAAGNRTIVESRNSRDAAPLSKEKFRIAGLVEESIVDGPGLRLVVFAQGCPHRCRGCHNPDTHSYRSGTVTDTTSIMAAVRANPLLDGITLSGGEPFEQALQLAALAGQVKKLGLHVMTYTGYTFEAIMDGLERKEGWRELLYRTDVLVDGPFMLEQQSFSLPFRGSLNQRLIDVPRSLPEGRAVLYPY